MGQAWVPMVGQMLCRLIATALRSVPMNSCSNAALAGRVMPAPPAAREPAIGKKERMKRAAQTGHE